MGFPGLRTLSWQAAHCVGVVLNSPRIWQESQATPLCRPSRANPVDKWSNDASGDAGAADAESPMPAQQMNAVANRILSLAHFRRIATRVLPRSVTSHAWGHLTPNFSFACLFFDLHFHVIPNCQNRSPQTNNELLNFAELAHVNHCYK